MAAGPRRPRYLRRVPVPFVSLSPAALIPTPLCTVPQDVVRCTGCARTLGLDQSTFYSVGGSVLAAPQLAMRPTRPPHPHHNPPPTPHSQLVTIHERANKNSCGGGCMLNTNEHFPNCSWVKVCNESMITSTRRVTRSCSTSERSLRAPLSSRSSCNNNPQSPHPPLAPHPRPHRPLRTSCP